MWYEITSLSDDSVAVKVRYERRLRNITNGSHELKNYLKVDEWGFF